MSAIDSATNASKTTNAVLTAIGAVTGLSAITDAASNFLKSVSMKYSKIPEQKLPLPNPLFAYASYTYVVGIGCLDDYDVHNPDSTYMSSKSIPLLCKSANAEPFNRVRTPYGAFDFFIDDLELASQIGFTGGHNTNVTDIKFKITEPFSMGMFVIACQQIAQMQGHANWRSAPFLLTVEFRGNTEQGQINNIPNITKKIPFKFGNIKMDVSDSGSIYDCSAYPWNQIALHDEKTVLKSDISIKGRSVQEVLQTGEKSLQAVINKRYERQKLECSITVPDQILILFPQEVASIDTKSSAQEVKSSATARNMTVDALYKKLGVSKKLFQEVADCNAIGKADMAFSEERKGDAPISNEGDVFDPISGSFIRGKMTTDVKLSDFRFSQNTTVLNAINQVLLASSFATETLSADKLSPEGYRDWWRIDVMTYMLSSDENTATGTKPNLCVYRVVPYQAHACKMAAPNAKVSGFANLKKQVIKEYNYIYTGQNVDIKTFNLTFNNGFQTIMAADGFSATQDVSQASQTGGTAATDSYIKTINGTEKPSSKIGVTPTEFKFTGLSASSDKQGGGGVETIGTRAARVFMDAITNGKDMYNLTMEIIGDPYFIVQSGMGNYTSRSSQYINLNTDGSVNYQNGEVVISVNFRSPIDINPTTGMYDFGKTVNSVPVLQYSGLYAVTNIANRFKEGQFTQTLTGYRLPQQENPVEAPPIHLFNTTSVSAEIKAAITPNLKSVIIADSAVGSTIKFGSDLFTHQTGN